jgi:hypothetical protein
VDFQALIDERLDNLLDLLQEEIPNAAGNLIPFWEQARSGIAAGSLEPVVQGFAVTASVLFTLNRSDRLGDLGFERLQQAATVVADAVLLAFPEAGLTIRAGRYKAPEGDEQVVVGPFLVNCVSTFRIQGEGDFQLQECVISVGP